MLRKQFPCIGPHATGVRQKTQSVPISASPLPAKKRAVLPQTEIFLIFLFSTPCSGYFDNRSVTDAIRPNPLLLQRSRSKSHTKLLARHHRLFTHSEEFPPA